MLTPLLWALAVLVAGAGCGAFGYRLRVARAGAPDAAGRGAAGASPATPVAGFLAGLTEFGEAVTLIWSTPVDASRQQMETAVGDLVATFAGIVSLLDTVLASSRSVLTGTQSEIFDTSRARLRGVVSSLDATLEMKRKTLEELRLLRTLNEDMKTMTSEVTKIAFF